ncbi:MAG TPA: anaerobic sulfatase maturase [Clostridia bacterium]|nr:anaerobic sulfatase maturase [Clostridia bacterium]
MNENLRRNINVLIKPSSGHCNLGCLYCFYHSPDVSDPTHEKGFMKRETAIRLIERAFDYTTESVSFAFQGGEPTLAGIDFFRFFVNKTREMNKGELKVNFSIQTNGIAIDDEWASFLSENKFLVGLSIDGPSRVHNRNRVFTTGDSSLASVMEAKRLFDEYKVEYNALSVVTSESAKYPEQIYDFFKKKGIGYVQYIPCLDPADEKPGLHEFSLSAGDYEIFLKKTFDIWYRDVVAGNITVVRTFDNWVAMILGYPPESCGMSGRCACQFVIEADGGIYPCDFYVTDETYIGNVHEDSFEAVINSEMTAGFLARGDEINEKCRSYRWFFICRDGCRRYRDPDTNLNIYCNAFENFFDYAYPRMQQIAGMLRNR